MRIIWTMPVTNEMIISTIENEDPKKIAKIISRTVPKGVEWKEIQESEVPMDRTFRNAMEMDNSNSPNNIRINMSKARIIHNNRIRHIRNKELEKEDKKEQIATRKKDNDEIINIHERKKALCNLPDELNLENYKTPEELKVVWPSILPLPDAELYTQIF